MFKRYDTYGTSLNTHDILKIIAIFTAVIDHIGYFFLPDEPTLRLIGRISMPIFLFLVGYSGRYSFNKSLLIWAVILAIPSVFYYADDSEALWQAVFPLNILFTIMIARMWLDWVERKAYIPQYLFCVFFMLCLWWVPVKFLLDYGSTAFMFALAGWIVRKNNRNFESIGTYLAIFGFHFFTQLKLFEFSTVQQAILVGELIVLGWLFFNYTSMQHIKKEGGATKYTIPLLFISRNTMFIYTLHVAVFMAIAKLLN